MVKFAMIGGGPGSMIGDIHRISAAYLGKAQLVAGVFSSDYSKSLEKGKALNISTSRIYKTVDELLESEEKLSKEDRIDFISIVTPNHLHAEAAIKALKAGFHVMCDKPLAVNLNEAVEIQKSVESSHCKFGMTYTYRGYAAIRELARQVKFGRIGSVRKVMIDYSQGWLARLVEKEGNKQAAWRTDPKYSGAGGTIADIGTHAFNMAEYVVGNKVERLVADINTLVSGRSIDDDANVLVEFKNDVTGVITVGQALTGEENSFTVKVYGEKGSLIWSQENPKQLVFKAEDKVNKEEIEEMDVDLSEFHKLLPKGHPESFLKGFIYLYDQFIDDINTDNKKSYPTIEDGYRGMLFIEKSLSSSSNKSWESL